MAERVEVVFFHIDGDRLGGGSKMLLKLLENLDTKQFTPKLVLQQEGVVFEEANKMNLDVKIVSYKGILDSYNRYLLSKSISRQICTTGRILQYNAKIHSIVRQADVIWCANLRVVLTLLPSIISTNTPVIWDIGLGLKSKGFIKYLNSLSLKVVHRVVIESDVQASKIFTDNQYSRYNSKFAYIHKGIDTTDFCPSNFTDEHNSEFNIVGTLAPLSPRKGIHHLIEAYSLIQESWDDVKLSIPSEPPEEHLDYYDSLYDLVMSYGMNDEVDFLGWVDSSARYLSMIDIFVLPSENEGIPGAVKEALAMEVPVIATDVGGMSDVIRDGKTGILVEPGDTDAIAEGIDYLLTHPEERNAMGTRGRELIVSEFSQESYIENYQAEFVNITSN